MTLLPDNWLDLSVDDIAQLSPLQPLIYPPLADFGVNISIKREDLLDPQLGGNKVYKLHGHLRQAVDGGYACVASFGGAYSNHLYALAAACRRLKLPVLGVVRGDEPPRLSPTLRDCKAMGMSLRFVSREDYRQRGCPKRRQKLQGDMGRCYWVEEGGAGEVGALACGAISRAIFVKTQSEIDALCLACGTGTTFAGIRAAAPLTTPVFGVNVLRNEAGLREQIGRCLVQLNAAPSGQWRVFNEYHCGGYAKLPGYLLEFIEDFEAQTALMLDPVYTAKLLWAVTDLVRQRFWPEGRHIVLLHSGGLQGRRGFTKLAQLPLAQ